MDSNKELTTSKVKNNQFHLGQLELSLIVKRIIRHYKYHNNNNNPEAIVIPLLREVEGVKILYEKEPTTVAKPRTGKPGGIRNQSNS